MINDAELSRLLAAERAEGPTAAQTAEGWKGLESALSAELPALAVASGPLKLGLSLSAKSFVGSGMLAFAVTTAGLGAHAAWQTPAAGAPAAHAPAALAPPSKPAAAAAALPHEVVVEPEASSAAPLTRPAPPKASGDAASTFADELRLIKAAKQALDAGRGHLAGVWLDEHARLYPSGVFRTERAELRRRLAASSDPKSGAR